MTEQVAEIDESFTSADIVNRIRGIPGTRVSLQLLRANNDRSQFVGSSFLSWSPSKLIVTSPECLSVLLPYDLSPLRSATGRASPLRAIPALLGSATPAAIDTPSADLSNNSSSSASPLQRTSPAAAIPTFTDNPSSLCTRYQQRTPHPSAAARAAGCFLKFFSE